MLADWENGFAQAIERVGRSVGARRPHLLPVLPDRGRWGDFVASVNTEWKEWTTDLLRWPSCLVMLYCGLAFYEYDENTFWPQFAKLTGGSLFSVNRQTEINNAFAKAANHFCLKLKPRGNGTDFVGTAVNLIGVPLPLWDGFLEICDWALWRKDWRALSDQEWV